VRIVPSARALQKLANRLTRLAAPDRRRRRPSAQTCGWLPCQQGDTAETTEASPAAMSNDDAGFLAALHQVGITSSCPGQAITSGKAVCTA